MWPSRFLTRQIVFVKDLDPVDPVGLNTWPSAIPAGDWIGSGAAPVTRSLGSADKFTTHRIVPREVGPMSENFADAQFRVIAYFREPFEDRRGELRLKGQTKGLVGSR